MYLEAKERNIEFYFHQSGPMFLKDGKNIEKWNLKEQIKCAEEVQHELERTCKKIIKIVVSDIINTTLLQVRVNFL